MTNLQPKVTIGLPVYNGEKNIKEAIESLISQTYKNFELIISDNASTDLTSTICKMYAKKDIRISYIRQKKTIGIYCNFNFVLESANSEYFMWASADDIWRSDFIEKNLRILESNENLVGSMGLIMLSGEPSRLYSNDSLNDVMNLENHVYSVTGNYEEKIQPYLRGFPHGDLIFGLYRTKKLQKRIVKHSLFNWDFAVTLNILHEGNFNAINEFLIYKSPKGMSRTTNSYIQLALKYNVSIPEILIGLYLPFTIWCAKTFGIKIFLKNFIWFLKLNYKGYKIVVFEIIRLVKRTICQQERWW